MATCGPDGLFDYLPKDAIIAAFNRSPGNEVGSGKLASPESSAALAANWFGFFLDQPDRLLPLPGTAEFGWPATRVAVEESLPFPWWPRGRHPWLDVVIETPTHLIAVESKRYEPFRGKPAAAFSDAYWRPVWGDAMGPFEAVRDLLADRTLTFNRLDAVQLVKHGFGARTEAHRRGKGPVLVYLFAEPATWPNGPPVDPTAKASHRAEVDRFARLVEGAEVAFRWCSYRDLVDHYRATGPADLAAHADLIDRTFSP